MHEPQKSNIIDSYFWIKDMTDEEKLQFKATEQEFE